MFALTTVCQISEISILHADYQVLAYSNNQDYICAKFATKYKFIKISLIAMAITKALSKDRKKCKVTFTLPAQAAPSAKVVKVVGDFNNWNWSKGVKLSKSAKEFRGQLDLEPGQRYEFRYLIDNKIWGNDWKADEYAPTPFGVDNSVVITPTVMAKATRASNVPNSAKKAPVVSKNATGKATAVTTKTRKTSKIDFTVLEGVGPKICQLLVKAGYKNFATLSTAKVGDLRKVLESAGSRYKMHDPSNWAKQAKMASKDQWSKLNAFQASLKESKK